MSTPKKVLIVGSANMDLIMNMGRLPATGETLIDDGGVAYLPGGKGAGVAITFSHLGVEPHLAAKLGADLHGQKLYSFYKDAGIDTSSLLVDHDAPTGLSVILREGNGDVRTVTYPGANEYLSSEQVISAMETEPDALCLGFEVPFPTVLAAAKVAAGKNIPIFVDASPASKDHALEKLPPVEIFSPNETETFTYTGIMPTGTDNSLRAALDLYRKVKCRHLVIKLGARGAFLYDGRHFDLVPAFRPDKVVDTSGSGDAFQAAMILAYLENGGKIKEAVRYGAAAGALAVSRKGSAASAPTREEIAQFLKTH